MECVRWYLSFKPTSRNKLHKDAYKNAKERFELKTALLQSARDKAVEIYKSFENVKGKDSELHLRNCCMRFDERSFRFAKENKELTPYWLQLSLSGNRGRTPSPIVFGERRELIKRALDGEYTITDVEMKKPSGQWYAHFILGRKREMPDSPQPVIGIDRGEKSFAVVACLEKRNPYKPRRGMFWSGAEIKALKGKYHHIRRNLGRKKLPQEIEGKLSRKTDQLLHKLANEIVEYASQFKKPVIVLEDLTHIRSQFQKKKKGKKLNRRMNSLPFRKLQDYIEYKVLKKGIAVEYIDPENTTKECHRCGTVNNVSYNRNYWCPNCGLTYHRDLNASINIAQRITSSLGWGTSECPEQPNEVNVAKT
ncbi:MAG: IS200/IS605 family element transposase accessory protein TnpB [Candidatus Lokiarchaeota archaeon]|nr:IS200/IS605 family element transposase accessory protein TnpB [Candidatus Lokiarchaeota archaeon]